MGQPGIDREVFLKLRQTFPSRRIEDAVDENEMAKENIAVDDKDRSAGMQCGTPS